MAYIYWLHTQDQTDYFIEGYIGVSNNPEKRLYQHRLQTEKEKHSNPHLANAIKKYNIIQTIILEGSEEYCYEIEAKLRPHENIGWNIDNGGHHGPSQLGKKQSQEIVDNRTRKITGKKRSEEFREECRQRTLGKKQSQETIQKRMSKIIGRKNSEEAKERMRQAALSDPSLPKRLENLRKSNIGKSISEEHKEKLRLSHLGKSLSEEHKKKISEAKKGKMPKFIPTRIGTKMSEETKQKISESKKKVKF